MNHAAPPAVATALAALLTACAAAPPAPPAPTGEFAALAPDEFPGAAALLAGFEAPSDDAMWLAGDRALFGLRLDRDGEVVRWLLSVELPLGQMIVAQSTDGTEHQVSVGASATWVFGVERDGGSEDVTIQSRLATAKVKVFTADGELLTETADTLPVDLLGRGLLPAIERARAAASAGGTVPTDRTTLEGYLAVRQLLETVRGNDALAEYFWQVVEKPSIWSVLTHFGVDVRIAIPLEDSVPAVPPPGVPAAATFAAPLRIEVNGSPVLFVELLVTDARRPLALCGGIVAAIARHPTLSDRTFRMQLLGARLGSVPRGRMLPKTPS
jgi:hypothetical protein